MFRHKNFTENARIWLKNSPIGIGDNYVSIITPAWVVDQILGFGICLAGGITINFPYSLETVEEDFREIGPHTIITSSRFWEDLASKIRVRLGDAGIFIRGHFAVCEKIGNIVVNRESKRQPIPSWLKALKFLASITMYSHILNLVGCLRFRDTYTGGHPAAPAVIRFFRTIGLNLSQAYGLTECGGLLIRQPANEIKLATVGKPYDELVKMKIGEDQEVLLSSGGTFAGYYQDPEATEKVLRDGWLCTGDAGYIDEDGHLLIIGRKEEIMRTKDGKAFSPDFIETRLKFSPYINEAVIFGEGQPFITAFINIDFGNVGNWAEEGKIPYTTYTDLSQQPEVEDLIRGEIREVNKQLPEPMQLINFILLYKLLDADDEELTRTGKVRRKFVFRQYKDLIDAMYSDKKELEVKGQVKYRDGHIGNIQTKVKILSVK